MCVSNPQNANFYHLPFYGDQSLITRKFIDSVNDDVLEMLNNGSIIGIYTNIM